MQIKTNVLFCGLLAALLFFLDPAAACGAQSLAPAVANLKSKDKKVRREAASELGVLGQREAVEPLGQA